MNNFHVIISRQHRIYRRYNNTAVAYVTQLPIMFCIPTLAYCTVLLTQHVRPLGFPSRWFNGLELAARWIQRSSMWHCQFQTAL